MLSRGEESCGDVGLNNGLSGFFMVGEDMSAGKIRQTRSEISFKASAIDSLSNWYLNMKNESIVAQQI